jgi:hypothetical protein
MLAVDENVGRARALAISCAEHSIYHYCPHTHSQHMDRYAPTAEYDYWIALDKLIIINVCNCMLMVDGWINSPGARDEYDLAQKLKYPIFYKFDHLLRWTLEGDKCHS